MDHLGGLTGSCFRHFGLCDRSSSLIGLDAAQGLAQGFFEGQEVGTVWFGFGQSLLSKFCLKQNVTQILSNTRISLMCSGGPELLRINSYSFRLRS